MQNNTDLTFGQRVKQRRKWLDLTQPQLAAQVGCAVITLQKIEANALRPSGQIAKRLAVTLQIPLEEHEIFLEAARAMVPQATKSKASTPPSSSAQLIGRERDVAAICAALLEPDVGLLTLAGPPGVGKTRLALAVMAQLSSPKPAAFADGVFFVSLAEVQDASLLPQAIAHALNLKDSSSQSPLDQLHKALKEKQALLILDNFEQVLPAAPALQALLATVHGVKVLVTSRALLKVEGERDYRVSPLELPDPAQSLSKPVSIAHLAQHAAIALFVERAKQANPAFAMTSANGHAIAQICIRLDGLPLAIELAAPHCRFLSPNALLQRLEQRLPMLESRAPSLPARQRRLHDAIAWSYEQLAPEEQVLFNQLGVCMGGWTTEAAEAMCNTDDASTPNVLDRLATLLDNSLIVQHTGAANNSDSDSNEPRFTMLETLREFALAQLTARGERDDVQRRHALYFLKVARENEMQMLSPRQAEILDLLDGEHDNFRAALRWALVHDAATALELSGRLYFFWQLRSYFREGRRWLEQALALNLPIETDDKTYNETDEQKVLRARALYGLGTLAYYQSDYANAKPSLEQALALRRELGDKRSQATLLNALGQIAYEHGALDEAGRLWEEAFALAQTIDDKPRMAATLSNLGVLAFKLSDFRLAQAREEHAITLARATGSKYNIASALNELGNVELKLGQAADALLHQEECLALAREIEDRNTQAYGLVGLGDVAAYSGEFDRARAFYEESLVLRRELDNRWGMGISLAHLGHMAFAQGEHGRAAALLNESLSIVRELEDRAGIAQALGWLGQTALAMGHLTQASAWHAEALRLQREIADKAGVLDSLDGLASILAASGHPLQAAQVWGAVEAGREQLGEKMAPHEQARRQMRMARARTVVDSDAFDGALAQGHRLSLDETIALSRSQPC